MDYTNYSSIINTNYPLPSYEDSLNCRLISASQISNGPPGFSPTIYSGNRTTSLPYDDLFVDYPNPSLNSMMGDFQLPGTGGSQATSALVDTTGTLSTSIPIYSNSSRQFMSNPYSGGAAAVMGLSSMYSGIQNQYLQHYNQQSHPLNSSLACYGSPTYRNITSSSITYPHVPLSLSQLGNVAQTQINNLPLLKSPPIQNMFANSS